MIAITHKQMMKLRPCSERARAVTRGMGGRKAWTQPADFSRLREAGATLNDLIWLATELSETDANIARRLRRWLADCAARVLHVYELHHDSDAPRNVIIASRQFARGEIDDAAMAAAQAAAQAAARAAARAGDAARDAAQEAARAAARDAAQEAARAAARAAAWAAARAAARAAAWAAARAGDAAQDAAWAAAQDAAWAAEHAWQFDHLIARMSESEPDDWPLPERQMVAAE